MEFTKLLSKPEFKQDKNFKERFDSFQKLINELEKRNIPEELARSINMDIDEINAFYGTRGDMLKQLKKTQSRIVKMLEQEFKLVTKHHYRTMWFILGMTAFGIPIGIAFGISVNNLGLLAVGLPIGMGIGIAIGSLMDKKARESGKQLDVELKY